MWNILGDILGILTLTFIAVQVNSLIINNSFIFNLKKLIKNIFSKDYFRILCYTDIRDQACERFYQSFYTGKFYI